MNRVKLENEVSIVISGEAGRGIQSLERMFSNLAKSAGYNVFTYGEFMSRIRGGNNSSEIRVAASGVSSFADRIDVFIPINKGAMSRFVRRISKDTLIIGDADHIDGSFKEGFKVMELPLLASVKGLGSDIYINTVVLGFLSALLNISFDSAAGMISIKFEGSKEEGARKNTEALKRGFELGAEKLSSGEIGISIERNETVKNDLVLYGSESIGLGALAGGCNFIASYPMSPSTGVLVFMAKNADEFSVIVEQAEDEISAINMGLGAWYAGARAMVTTSGGGFALMTEALSLAGAIESPMVIHLGQRPGPATGMPTRTEQGDFFTALHAGHGEFPRIILSPCDREDGIKLACRAFNMADRYQVPVIILTDQYFMDSSVNVKDFGISELPAEKYITKTQSDYARYEFTGDGISPRGIPGYGEGIVCVDSDEHDETGHITEDFDVRARMADKRLKKHESVTRDVIPPRRFGKEFYIYAVVSWGSTQDIVKEALSIIGRDDISFFSFSQLYPLYEKTAEILNKADVKIIVENNASSQFGSFIRQETGIAFDHKILKYSGMPFSVEEIEKKIREILQGEKHEQQV